MPAALLEVETDDFADAARSMYHHVADPVAEAVFALTAALAGTGGMAGSDPGGRAWADSYDHAAKSAIAAGIAVANGCYHLSAMFAQTARNYETADAASAPSDGRIQSASLPDPTRVDTNAFPPRAGGTPDFALPGHWSLVAHLVPHIWPNGHQDRLRRAARAWSAAATAVSDRAYQATLAALAFPRDRLPEADDMLAVCQGMTQHLNDLADTYRSLAHACSEMARHIDSAHTAVEGELSSLIAQSAAIQGGGFLASLVTFGLAEAPTQGLEAGRIALAAVRITALLEKFGATARAVAATVTAEVVRLDHIAAEMRGLYGVRLTSACVQSVKALPAVLRTREGLALRGLTMDSRGLPAIRIEFAAARDKFKHARDFGVLGNKNTRNIGHFATSIERFVNARATVRVRGTYRGQSAILNFDPTTKLVVVQRIDGTFWSGWRASAKALRNIRVRRSLGGS